MAKITFDGFRCERCEHEWVPRETTKGEPTICPECKSPYWNRPRLNGNKRRAMIRHFRTKKGKKNA